MSPVKPKTSVGLVLAIFVSSLAISATAGARILPEPGPGSPVTHQHHRQTAAKKKSTRKFAGYPSVLGRHVRVPVQERTE
jgi:hypothetical protein